MQYLTLPTEFKAAEDATIQGHASIFGNVDLGGDIVEPGAFKEIMADERGRVPLLWQHNREEPIGIAKVWEDAKGLAFSGGLVLADPLAVKARAHIREGSCRGMSIGYDVLPGGAQALASGARALKALRLWEISVVTFGMNPLARVEAIKSRVDLERAAREVLGLSKTKAKRLSQAAWPAISGEEIQAEEAEALRCSGAFAETARQIAALNQFLKRSL